MTNTHNEAPASLNFTGVTQRGWRIQLTLRDDNEANLLERFKTTTSVLLDLGITPNGAKEEPAAVASSNGAPPAVATPTATQGDEDSFSAETLVASVNEGKAYWKVQGGPFSKFGVTVWPEVLGEAGFDCDQLDPTQTYDLAGHTATYLRVDGKPKKVTRLAKAK